MLKTLKMSSKMKHLKKKGTIKLSFQVTFIYCFNIVLHDLKLRNFNLFLVYSNTSPNVKY